ncbi:MAG: DNA/RNA non-specific endonuclease [Lachnospiraceae bacterium]|nr:DNA/RNA non-specific endonuclease [Lachnospiraceae bacterium]
MKEKLKQHIQSLLLFVIILIVTILVRENEQQQQQQSVLLENAANFTQNEITEPYIELNNNIPQFDKKDKKTEAFEIYSELDELGRCQLAYANICKELMPDDERESIGSVKPTGWKTKKYKCVEGRYLYNRCHLIGFQLAGENANKLNLITGTRYLNVTGMLPFENMVADYVKEYDNHVLYRVTPYFEGEELVARGVQMEGYSVEDNGEGISFNVFVYNIQPGVEIDYATGKSHLYK